MWLAKTNYPKMVNAGGNFAGTRKRDEQEKSKIKVSGTF
jgi:hypothetical protein